MTTRTDDVAAGISQRPMSAARSRRSWSEGFAARLRATDVLVIFLAVVIAQFARLGPDIRGASISSWDLQYSLISVLLILGWMIALSATQTRDRRVIGAGSVEYRRVVSASLRCFGVVAVLAYLLQIDLARGYLLIALPLGLLGLIGSRWAWRQWLAVKRRRGEYSSRVILVGSKASIEQVGAELLRQPEAGYWIVAACVLGSKQAPNLAVDCLETVYTLDDVSAAMSFAGAETVVIAGSERLPASRIRELSWSLKPGEQHLVVAPGLTDVGGPRIHTRPVAGLPLLHVETPRYAGSKRFTKRAFDIVASAGLLLVLSPVFALLALLVAMSSPGPIIFKQSRVGLNGSRFTMLKFRSMVVDAEARLLELEKLQRAEGNTVLFKMADDPRVTRIGRIMRRYSLDELPQIWNVFRGEMSIVGPRPPLEKEVAQYESHVHRRFMVKPGITGLWQVSGRSNLSWEDTVRLDLYYVENWSLTADLVILWKTVAAVFGRSGAY